MKRCSIFSKVSFVMCTTISIGCFSQAVAQENTYRTHFVVIGDRAGGPVPGIYSQIVTEIDRLKPDFVVTVGDMIEGPAYDTAEANRRWNEYKSLVSPLTAPVYFTPGNNDIWNDVSLKLYQSNIGEPYYSFNFRDLHFVILDNSRWGSSKELPAEQINWLISNLKKYAKASYTFVFYHKPFWYETTAANKNDTLHSLFRNFGVDAVFAGHYHIYFSEEYDGIVYTTVGSSGGGCDPGPTGLEYHFVWVTADENGITVTPIKMGAVLPRHEVTATDLRFIDKIYFKGLDFKKPLSISEDLSITDGELVVKLSNLNPHFVLTDTVHWKVPEGWSVDPDNLPVKVKAGDSRVFKFKVKHKGKLYPVPSISTHFPYASGKNYELKKKMPIAREASCYRANIAPVIDGNISEAMWQNPISTLFSGDGNPMSIDSTYFYFLYDENNIYIAVYCKDLKIDSIVAAVRDHDGGVYSEDCVGYFFQPDMDRSIVYQIYINLLGSIFDQMITISGEGELNAERTWNGTYEVKTVKGSDFWSVEARIPVSQFKTTIKTGQKWGLNFRRKQKRFNTAADWQVPITYDPKTYGFMIMK